MNKILRNIYNQILNIIYPDKKLTALSKNTRGQLPIHISTHRLQVKNKKPIKATAISDYANQYVHDIIWTLKYNGNHQVVELIANALSEYLIEQLSARASVRPAEKVLIIPIPLHKARQRTRGFNQLHLVLDIIKKQHRELLPLINYNLLIKPEATKSQTHLSRKERLSNVKGVFKVVDKNNKLNNAHVILIDDVMTTGATVAEACTTLLASGIKSMEVLTIARRL